MNGERKTLGQLFMPICIETLLFMLSGIVDTLMLSSVGDKTVGAVGTANTYISIFIIMFGIITSGMTAVMTQNIGAGRDGVVLQARRIGLIFNGILGVIFSLFLGFFSDGLLNVIGISQSLKKSAGDYLVIVGSFSFVIAITPVYSGYLKSYGYTKQCLTASIIGNILNLVLNSVALYVLKWGVRGVAVSTVISRIVILLILIIQSGMFIRLSDRKNRISNREIIIQIVKIGIPSALETGLYDLAMVFVARFLNQMDSEGINITAKTYASQIASFSYCVGVSLAQANAILTGWRIGEKKYDECSSATNKAAITGIITALATASVIEILSPWIMSFFTDSREMINLVRRLLAIDIILEIGRVSNLVYGNALKTSGDAVFPAAIAAVFMYLFAVFGTYVFGISMGLLAVGAYIGLTLDECVRALCMFFRWRSGRWRKYSVVKDIEKQV